MPKTIWRFSTLVSKGFEISAVAIGRNATLPPVGTHWRNVNRIHGRTEVKVLLGFRDGLRNVRTAGDLRDHIACYLRLADLLIPPSRVLIFGHNHKTLHGRQHIV